VVKTSTKAICNSVAAHFDTRTLPMVKATDSKAHRAHDVVSMLKCGRKKVATSTTHRPVNHDVHSWLTIRSTCQVISTLFQLSMRINSTLNSYGLRAWQPNYQHCFNNVDLICIFNHFSTSIERLGDYI
jgi:hypothetical protein